MGLPRSKGIIIKQENVTDYFIQSDGSDQSSSSNEIRRNRRWEFQLRAPLVLKDNFKMAVGVKYFVEEFRFDDTDSEFEFYNNLEDRSLRNLATSLFLVKPTRTNRYYLLRLNAQLNGDFSTGNISANNFLKYSITPLVGWKKNDYTSYAFGFSFGYSFGQRSIFPIFSYNKSFNTQWGIETILPVKARLRYGSLDQKSYVYLTSELNGASYNIDIDLNNPEGTNFLFLNKSEVRFLISLEREIHDWLWFGVEGGMRKNINFDLTSSPRRNTDIIIENQLNNAFLFSVSLFIVPPRKFLE
ncbi:MAG: hypothetical protein AAFX87_00920 [Bacteroidota bacterium]